MWFMLNYVWIYTVDLCMKFSTLNWYDNYDTRIVGVLLSQCQGAQFFETISKKDFRALADGKIIIE